ncbi:transcriptional regulator (plasmid) [Hymenobacter psoromatis]|nr:transcriptional regulator [Hymenobacter psoromatis]
MTSNSASEWPAFPLDELKLQGFKAYKITEPVHSSPTSSRRDFYKIVLVTGQMTICHGEESTRLDGTFLFLGNPLVPNSAVHHSTKNNGYACLFTDAFLAGRKHSAGLQQSPLFHIGAPPIILLNDEQAAFMTALFQQLLAVHNGGYAHKDELIKTYLALLIQEALRMQSSPKGLPQKNAAGRITQLFLELLERQFPIESPAHPLRLRTAQSYASSLSVHVNYLNRSVKEVTGKPTSVHIAERLVLEAKALLQHTTWSIADIADGLGFEYSTYFNNYFKRVTGLIPTSYRARKV